MMNRFATLTLLTVIGCIGCATDVAPTTKQAEQGLCTIEDQSAGLCAGPFTVLANHTRDVAEQNGADVADATVDCISGVGGQRFCAFAQDLLFCRLFVNCTLYADGQLGCDVGCL